MSMTNFAYKIDIGVVPRVSLGQDGLIYLTGGTNGTLKLYSDRLFQADVDRDGWIALVAARSAFFAEQNIPWRFVLSTEKLSIYGDDELARQLAEPVTSPGQAFKSVIQDDAVLYPRDLLRAEIAQNVYVKTDSHWSPVGAFLVFQEMMRSVGLSLDWGRYTAMPDGRLTYHGDLWSADYGDVGPDVFLRRKIDPAIRTVYKNPIVGLSEARGGRVGLHVGSHLIWRNPTAEVKKNVILFGSSFSESRLECTLLSYLFALYFEEVHFIWSTSLDKSYITRTRPDYVFVEMPERFVRQVPADDLSIERFGAAEAEKWLMANP
ncbi:hypothetical protein [Lichenihabitans psoromatis]|uniref:hypothetical protein n=1 Tax=Lichenihabitans psoromatis TaxID=2528642 RepID=UPI001036A28C|nr:hypothetical protein [Lichenihabitans psoromatis]